MSACANAGIVRRLSQKPTTPKPGATESERGFYCESRCGPKNATPPDPSPLPVGPVTYSLACRTTSNARSRCSSTPKRPNDVLGGSSAAKPRSAARRARATCRSRRVPPRSRGAAVGAGPSVARGSERGVAGARCNARRTPARTELAQVKGRGPVHHRRRAHARATPAGRMARHGPGVPPRGRACSGAECPGVGRAGGLPRRKLAAPADTCRRIPPQSPGGLTVAGVRFVLVDASDAPRAAVA